MSISKNLSSSDKHPEHLHAALERSMAAHAPPLTARDVVCLAIFSLMVSTQAPGKLAVGELEVRPEDVKAARSEDAKALLTILEAHPRLAEEAALVPKDPLVGVDKVVSYALDQYTSWFGQFLYPAFRDAAYPGPLDESRREGALASQVRDQLVDRAAGETAQRNRDRTRELLPRALDERDVSHPEYYEQLVLRLALESKRKGVLIRNADGEVELGERKFLAAVRDALGIKLHSKLTFTNKDFSQSAELGPAPAEVLTACVLRDLRDVLEAFPFLEGIASEALAHEFSAERSHVADELLLLGSILGDTSSSALRGAIVFEWLRGGRVGAHASYTKVQIAEAFGTSVGKLSRQLTVARVRLSMRVS